MKIKKLIKKYNLFSGTQVIIMPHNSGTVAYHVFEQIK